MTIHDHTPDEPCPRDPRAMELAGIALRAAIAGDLPAAADAVQAINDETGPEGLADAVLAWCDTYVGDRPTAREGAFAVPAWKRTGTDTLTRPEDVPIEVVWAGRLVVARANDDHDGFFALLDALPDDPKLRGDHIWGLVNTIALSLREPTRRTS